MRLITRKIYRAFPELDQFDDKACGRYVYRAKRKQNGTLGLLFYLLTVISMIALWIFLGVPWMIGFDWVTDLIGYRPGPYLRTFSEMMYVFGFIWFPWICCLLVRDLLLHKAVKNQVQGACCDHCNYRLVGLEILDLERRPSVQCPECGWETVLEHALIEKWEINPSL